MGGSLAVLAALLLASAAASSSTTPSSARHRAASVLLKGLSLCSLTIATSTRRCAAANEAREMGSVEEAADYIQQNCKTILLASRSCGKLLFRGDERYSSKLALRNPPPDLLDEGTYFGQEGAADYFKALDDRLYAQGCSAVRNGHIATSNPSDAGKWGPIEVVFPIDGDYVTLAHDPTFWKNSYSQMQSTTQPRGTLFWRNDRAMRSYLSEEVRVNRGLEAALSRESEVLFAPRQLSGGCSFVSVPIASSTKMCALLDIKPFSSKVAFSKAQGMEIEGDVRKLSNPTRFVFY